MAADSKTTKTTRKNAAQRAELKLNSAQGDVDKLAKRLDALEVKEAKIAQQRAQLGRDHQAATARRDYALSNPELWDEAREAGTPGPTGFDGPQSTTRGEPLSAGTTVFT